MDTPDVGHSHKQYKDANDGGSESIAVVREHSKGSVTNTAVAIYGGKEGRSTAGSRCRKEGISPSP